MTSFSQLLNDVRAYVEDDGAEFVAALPRIVALGHEKLARILNLDVMTFEAGKSTAAGNPVIDMTAEAPQKVDYLYSAYGIQVERRSQAYVRMHGGSGIPMYFCDHERGVMLAPTPDAAYPLLVIYHAALRPLSTTNETDWFTRLAPAALLEYCIAEAYRFLKNEPRAEIHEARGNEHMALVRLQVIEMVRREYAPVAPTPEPKGDAA